MIQIDINTRLEQLRKEYVGASIYRKAALTLEAKNLKKELPRPVVEHVHKASLKSTLEGNLVTFICNCGFKIGEDMLMPRSITK